MIPKPSFLAYAGAWHLMVLGMVQLIGLAIKLATLEDRSFGGSLSGAVLERRLATWNEGLGAIQKLT